MQVFTRKVYSLNDCLNDFTGLLTGAGAVFTIVSAFFSYFFFLIEWIELNYYVKTKDNLVFDSGENYSDKRIKKYYHTLNSFNFSEE